MYKFTQILLLFLFANSLQMCFCSTSELANGSIFPTVAINILVRNKAHTLPQFLTSLMDLDYPKERIFLWIRSDYNIDNSVKILGEFSKKFGTLYNKVHFSYNSSLQKHEEEMSPNQWTPFRHSHIIRWKEWAIMFSKRQWADYVFMVDADVIFTNPLTLQQLVSKRLPVVAPMLVSDRYYSNFWLDIDENYSYQPNNNDDYLNIYQREEEFLGCHAVPVVYGAVLIDMRYHQADDLTYDPMKIPDYKGPKQEHIVFAMSAKIYNISIFVCNDLFYGFINRPAEEDEPLSVDIEHFTNLKLLAIARTTPLKVHYKLEHFVQYPPIQDYQVDAIYMINLERRSDKRKLMELAFKELGMNVTRREAVDGRTLNEKKLKEMNVTLLPEYEDPYHKRPMTYGEIGCFLSHYKIWVETLLPTYLPQMLIKRYNRVVIIEDDVHFLPNFKKNYDTVLSEFSKFVFDFLYLGRKVLLDKVEHKISPHLSLPLYSYWTIGYMITDTGARKLVRAKPLSKLMPVDEFLPVMFNQHPDNSYNIYFPIRNLNTVSAYPVIIQPTHYTGMPGYISDTENSPLLPRGKVHLQESVDQVPKKAPRVPAQKLEF